MCIALQLGSDVEQPWLIGNIKSEDLPISKENLAKRARKLRLMNKKRYDSGRKTARLTRPRIQGQTQMTDSLQAARQQQAGTMS